MTIQVTFPDDATFTARLVAPATIRRSNGTAWTKVALASSTHVPAGGQVTASV